MSTKGDPVFTFSLPGRVARPLAPSPSVTPLLTGLVLSEKWRQAFCSTHYRPTYITKSQRHKKRMLIVIHFNPSRSFFYIEIFC